MRSSQFGSAGGRLGARLLVHLVLPDLARLHQPDEVEDPGGGDLCGLAGVDVLQLLRVLDVDDGVQGRVDLDVVRQASVRLGACLSGG